MRQSTLPVLFSVVLAVSSPSILSARKKVPTDQRFSIKLPKDKEAEHLVERLTFGPRTGDVEQVRRTGTKKWLGQQLHPERIREQPLLERKLAELDTLRQTPEQTVKNY